MQTNKELKIALIVGMIMITICAVVFIFYKSDSNSNEIDIKVYKVNEEEKVYEPCVVPQEKAMQIFAEYKSATRLSENNRVVGKKITGKYKVMSGNDYIAFDGEKEKDYVFRGDTQYMYEYKTTLYDIVKEICE